jgi:hypothetical protein
LNAIQALSQLSYGPIRGPGCQDVPARNRFAFVVSPFDSPYWFRDPARAWRGVQSFTRQFVPYTRSPLEHIAIPQKRNFSNHGWCGQDYQRVTYTMFRWFRIHAFLSEAKTWMAGKEAGHDVERGLST